MSVFSIAKRVLFPLEWSIALEQYDTTWFYPLAFDAAFLHSVVFATHAYYDLLIDPQHTISREATQHCLKTIQLLRQRLLFGEQKAKLSDSTISAIMTLAMSAYKTGDYETAKQHMQGLDRIIGLRGGLDTLKGNGKLMAEIIR